MRYIVIFILLASCGYNPSKIERDIENVDRLIYVDIWTGSVRTYHAFNDIEKDGYHWIEFEYHDEFMQVAFFTQSTYQRVVYMIISYEDIDHWVIYPYTYNKIVGKSLSIYLLD